MSNMKVTYKDHMGSDLTVVNAARVSFSKESTLGELGDIRDGDKKLINYLADHEHWTPSAHCMVQLHVKAPIFVARQLAKHQVGLVWNEVSRRYVDTQPELYWPSEWRKKAANKKQGSSDEVVKDIIISKYSYETTEDGETIENESQDFVNIADFVYPIADDMLYAYKRLISNGVCPEQARMILPLNTYTEFWWTGSLAAFARVVNLRTTMDTQKETREIALQIKQILLELFPESAKALLTTTKGE